MSDLESLFVVLAAIYVADCVVFLRRGAVLFTGGPARFRPIHSGSVLANASGGFRLLSPLPRYPAGCVVPLPACTLSPEGVLNWTPFCTDRSWRRQVRRVRFLPWSGLGSVETDRHHVLAGGSRLVQAGSTEEAIQIAALLRRIGAESASGRARAIEAWIRSALDVKAAGDRWRDALKECAAISPWSQTLAAFLFLACPALIWKLGLETAGWWLVGGIYLQSAWIAFQVHRAHRRLYPQDGDGRFVRVLTALIAPLSAIRAPDELVRNSLVGFHPACAAGVLCSADESGALLARVLRDIRHPILPEHPSDEPAVRSAVEWSLAAWRAALDRWASDRKPGTLETLLAPPIRAEAVNRSYCPRCLDQFTETQAVCSECGGRATQAWPES